MIDMNDLIEKIAVTVVGGLSKDFVANAFSTFNKKTREKLRELLSEKEINSLEKEISKAPTEVKSNEQTFKKYIAQKTKIIIDNRINISDSVIKNYFGVIGNKNVYYHNFLSVKSICIIIFFATIVGGYFFWPRLEITSITMTDDFEVDLTLRNIGYIPVIIHGIEIKVEKDTGVVCFPMLNPSARYILDIGNLKEGESKKINISHYIDENSLDRFKVALETTRILKIKVILYYNENRKVEKEIFTDPDYRNNSEIKFPLAIKIGVILVNFIFAALLHKIYDKVTGKWRFFFAYFGGMIALIATSVFLTYFKK